MTRWRKLGHIYTPAGDQEWSRTHAANSVAVRLDAHRYRIFFSTRDRDNRASIGWIEVDLRRPQEVLSIARQPILGPGPTGTFDDSGASLACIVQHDSRFLLYYTGWNLGVTVPWRNSIGLAVSDDGLHFERASPAPVLDRNRVDPDSLSSPFVMPPA